MRLAAVRVPIPNSEGLEAESHRNVIPLLCSIFLANHGAGDVVGEGNLGDEAGDGDAVPWVSDLLSCLLSGG